MMVEKCKTMKIREEEARFAIGCALIKFKKSKHLLRTPVHRLAGNEQEKKSEMINYIKDTRDRWFVREALGVPFIH